MRDAYFSALAELGARDERVWALTGDLGIGLFDAFERIAPGRHLNVGIAEQNLVGVAAGLAYAGKLPFAYSIAPFMTSRPHDQIRVDVALPAANVKLVGVGGGVAYGTLGPTHHAIEDIALMRCLPNMTVLTPGDPAEAYRATLAAAAHEGPVYLRLGKNGEPRVLPADAEFAIGRALRLSLGDDVAILSAGAILPEARRAAALLEARGVRVSLTHFGTVKPLDRAAVAEAAATGSVVTVEEHTVIGGFGGAVAEALGELGCAARLHRVGLRDVFAREIGSRAHLIAHHRLDAAAVANAAAHLLDLEPIDEEHAA